MKVPLSLLLALIPAIAAAQHPEAAATPGLLQVHKSTGPFLEVALHDPRNRSWTLQASRDLTHWKSIHTLQVANTAWRTSLPLPVGQPALFARVVQAPASPGVLSSSKALALGDYQYDPLESVTSSLRGRSGTSIITTRPEILERLPAGATLGRVLFYDKRLSQNNTVSCASCHQQRNAFSDPRPVSIGFDGQAGTRNAPSLVNTNFGPQADFFWDSRVATLEEAVLVPIQHPQEMGLTLDALCEKLATEPFYSELFTARFNDPEITSDRVAIALSQFLRTIVSANTSYDRWYTSGAPALTESEQRGLSRFESFCASCHTPGLFQVPRIHNIGLGDPVVDRGTETGNESDIGMFKVPTLRNIAVTAPYMHDGRFQTLAEVINHYSEGVEDSADRWARRALGAPRGGLHLSNQEKADLIAFLRTLTDESLLTDPRYSDPFRYGDNAKSENPSNVGGP